MDLETYCIGAVEEELVMVSCVMSQLYNFYSPWTQASFCDNSLSVIQQSTVAFLNHTHYFPQE